MGVFFLFFLSSGSSASEFMCRRFETLCSVFIGRCSQDMKMDQKQRPMKMAQTDCSEASVHKYQTPGNRPKEIIQPSQYGEGMKSRKDVFSAINANMRRCGGLELMCEKLNVLEIGRLVGIVLTAIDV